jgi:hypothetical protein
VIGVYRGPQNSRSYPLKTAIRRADEDTSPRFQGFSATGCQQHFFLVFNFIEI